MILTLTTPRLVLRAPQMSDFPAYCGFVTSDRAAFMGGPHDAAKAWDWFCNAASHRLCERLGGALDDAAPCPYPPPVRIYRYQAGGRA